MGEQTDTLLSLCMMKESDDSCSSQLETSSFYCFPLGELPPEVLVHIFTFLSDNELFHLSAVCKTWRDVIYNTSALWKNQHYNLQCKRRSTKNKWSFWFANRFGHHLRHLSVKCEHHFTHEKCRIMAVRVRKLLNILRCPPHLSCFRMAEIRLGGASPAAVSDVSSIMTGILLKAPPLKVFEMPSAHWPSDKGQNVLDAVFLTSRNSLDTLRLDDYFDRHMKVDTDRLTAGLTALTRLTKLSLSYVYLTDDCIIALALARKGELKKLKLWSSYVSPNVRLISQKSWIFLTESCPALKVEFKIGGTVVSPSVSIPAILSPALRVTSLKMSIGDRFLLIDQPGPNMSSVLQHISKHYRKNLRKFQLDIDNNGEDLDTALIQMVVRCRCLVKLKVTAILSSQQTDKTLQEIIRARRYLSVVSRSAKHLKTSNGP